MNCILCTKPIKNYNEKFNHLKIDESHSADLCHDCTDKVIRWQGSIIRELFPTKTMKKRFEK